MKFDFRNHSVPVMARIVLLAALSAPQLGLAQAAPVDEEAAAALKTMGDYIAGLRSLTFSADTEAEIVLDNDQKLLMSGQVYYQATRPGHVAIELMTDVVRRELYYDGATVTYVAPDDGYYATVEETGDIATMLKTLAGAHALAFPLADIFAWGTNDTPLDVIREGFFVGFANIDGVATDHWAFRSADQDWEVWIQADGNPVPLQVSVVDKDVLARPRFTARLKWDVESVPGPEVFTYSPAEGMSAVPLITYEDADKEARQ
ncbi:DUF2092 domain-containing protein [Chachezhania sediminis]|uniref:DUF2092 domain-containing protein n=1 Tax=Chachezhania sediminis TaxID=2599291 RepID=UPI00131EA9FE|nr:DUF2092 domain-containing protein [Chachezhania sediminis]